MADPSITEEVLAQLTKPRLNAFQQAHILIKAIQAEIARKPQWSTKEIRKAYAELVGKGVNKIRPTTEWHLTGYAGEVVLHNGVTIFFQNPEVRERYGYGHISSQMEIMVSAEGVKGGVDFPERRQQWLAEAKRVFSDVLLGGAAGDSITDFFWREGVPVEHKAKTFARVYTSKDGKQKIKSSKDPFRGEANNAYVSSLQKTRDGIVIGWTWFTVQYDRVTDSSKEYQQAKKKVGSALNKISKALSSPVVEGGFLDPSEVDEVFIAAGVIVEGFMPMVVSEQGFKKRLNKKVNLAAANTDRYMNTKVVRENIAWIERLIQQRSTL